ncbi:MAG: hypothetical protein PHW69_08755 [Elusimicrobiaceae bacterium]|nr:hypothetical protein [Elusimicrobiaceae bacterium]
MISERTIEMTCATRITELLRAEFGAESLAIAPSFKPGLAYDAAPGVGGRGFLVQMKCPRTEKSGYRYSMNDTVQKDRLLRLLHLERLGYPVYYGLAMYHLFSQAAAGRGELCAMTAWYTPSQLMPKTGPVGRYEIRFDHSENTWSIPGRRREYLPPPLSFKDVLRDFAEKARTGRLRVLLEKLNSVALRGIEGAEGSYLIAGGMPMPPAGPARTDFLRGQFVAALVIADELRDFIGPHQ